MCTTVYVLRFTSYKCIPITGCPFTYALHNGGLQHRAPGVFLPCIVAKIDSQPIYGCINWVLRPASSASTFALSECSNLSLLHPRCKKSNLKYINNARKPHSLQYSSSVFFTYLTSRILPTNSSPCFPSTSPPCYSQLSPSSHLPCPPLRQT
jgi:hypothetical protein